MTVHAGFRLNNSWLSNPPLKKGELGGFALGRLGKIPPHPPLVYGPESRVTGVPDTWVTHSDPSAQIELGHTMLTEPDVKDAIRRGRLHPHGVPGEGFRDPQGAPLEIEPPALLDPADGHPGRIPDGRERRREGAEARLISGGRHGEGQGIVGALAVVDLAPAVEGGLAVGESELQSQAE